MLVTGLVFFQGAVADLTSQIQNKIDITAYFKDGTPEQDILSAKDEILKLSSNIRAVEYISEDQALQIFYEKHQDNPVLAQALQEVGENPFLPSLNITTSGDPLQYAQVSNVLQGASFSDLVEKVDFSEKRDTIEKVYSITKNINIFGIIFEIILTIVAILVVFNTIRLGIESSKEEIATMRVVGASNSFVRGPFIVQGIIYGVISFVICFSLSLSFAFAFSPKISIIIPGFNLLSFFLTNWWIFVLIQLGFGVAVGAISAVIVVKKYLES